MAAEGMRFGQSVSVYLAEDQIAALDAEARRRQMLGGRSTLVRQAISEFLARLRVQEEVKE